MKFEPGDLIVSYVGADWLAFIVTCVNNQYYWLCVGYDDNTITWVDSRIERVYRKCL